MLKTVHKHVAPHPDMGDVFDQVARLTRGLAVARLAVERLSKDAGEDPDFDAVAMHILELEYLATEISTSRSVVQKAA